MTPLYLTKQNIATETTSTESNSTNLKLHMTMGRQNCSPSQDWPREIKMTPGTLDSYTN